MNYYGLYFLYALAGYYRIYGKRFFIKNRYLIISVIIGLLVTLSSAELITVGSFDHTFLSDYIYHFYKMNSILVLIIAVAMCLFFNQIKIRSMFINIAASTSFGVYLIHDHSGISAFLWKSIFHVSDYQYSYYLIPYSLLVILSAYIMCFIIDYIRMKTIEKKWILIADKMIIQIKRIMDRLRNVEEDKQ